MTGPVRAITVRQPWAQCIAIEAKTVENRGRPTSYRGEVAIHAGATRDAAGDRDSRVVSLWGRDPSIGLPFRAVVAVAQLTDCHAAVRRLDGTSCCGPWGAVLTERSQLRRAVAQIRSMHRQYRPAFTDEFNVCSACTIGMELVRWPCDTIKAIEEATKP